MVFSHLSGSICALTVQSPPTKKILSQDTATLAPTQQERTCNCQKKAECPLEGKYLQANVVHQASVTTETTNETSVGLATNFKDRYRNHMSSFRHTNRRNETKLLKHIQKTKTSRNLITTFFSPHSHHTTSDR